MLTFFLLNDEQRSSDSRMRPARELRKAVFRAFVSLPFSTAAFLFAIVASAVISVMPVIMHD